MRQVDRPELVRVRPCRRCPQCAPGCRKQSQSTDRVRSGRRSVHGLSLLLLSGLPARDTFITTLQSMVKPAQLLRVSCTLSDLTITRQRIRLNSRRCRAVLRASHRAVPLCADCCRNDQSPGRAGAALRALDLLTARRTEVRATTCPAVPISAGRPVGQRRGPAFRPGAGPGAGHVPSRRSRRSRP